MEVLSRTVVEKEWGSTRARCGRRVLAMVVMILLLGAGYRSAAQDISREYQLKAVLLYNLTQFVEWPTSAFESPDSPFVICVLGADPFGRVLEDAVRGERSNNRRIVIRRINRIEEARDAQVVFISPGRRRELVDILEWVRGQPVLTVADFDGFLRGGGMVRMAPTPDRKIKIRINLDLARASGLTMSAKLLRVCTVVQAGDE